MTVHNNNYNKTMMMIMIMMMMLMIVIIITKETGVKLDKITDITTYQNQSKQVMKLMLPYIMEPSSANRQNYS
jgi:hypothetical protein